MSNKSSKTPKGGKLLLDEINQLEAVICFICKGYIIDATSLSECLHTFCRSCIVKHIWKGHLNCPTCTMEIHKTRPLLNLRHDPVKQELIYRLVPGLQQREIERRRKYLEERKDDFPNASIERMNYDHCNLIPLPKMIAFRLQSIFGFGIKLSEKSEWREVIGDYRESYLRMRVSVTVDILQRFILSRSGDISKQALVLLIFRDLVLDPDDSLAKLQEFDPDPNGEITINFGIYVHKSEPETKPIPAIAAPTSEPVSKKPKLAEEVKVTVPEEKKAIVPRQTKPARRKNRPPTKIPMTPYNYHEPAHDILGDIMKGLSVPSKPAKQSPSPARPINMNRVNGNKASSSSVPSSKPVSNYRPIQPAPMKVPHHNLTTGIDLARLDGHAAATLAQQLDQSRHTDRVAPIKLVMSPQSSKVSDQSERRCSYVIVSPSDSNEGRDVVATSMASVASVSSVNSSRPFSSASSSSAGGTASNDTNRNLLSDLLSKPVTVSTPQQQQQPRHQISNEMKAKPNRRKQKLMKPTHIRVSYEEEPPRMRPPHQSEHDAINHHRQQQLQRDQAHAQHQHNNNNKAKRPEVCHMNVSFNEALNRKPPVAVSVADMVRAASSSCSTHQQEMLNINQPVINSMTINNFNNNPASFVEQAPTHGSQHQQQPNPEELRRRIDYRNNSDAEAHRIALERARKVMQNSTLGTTSSVRAQQQQQQQQPKKPRHRVILPKPSVPNPPFYAVPVAASIRPAPVRQVTVRQKYPPPPQQQQQKQLKDESFNQTLKQQMAQHAASLAKIQSYQMTPNNKAGSANIGRNNTTCLITRNDILRSSITSCTQSTPGTSTQPHVTLGRVRSSSYKDQPQPSSTRRLSGGSGGSSVLGTANGGRTFEYRVSSSPSTSTCPSFTGGKHNLPVESIKNYSLSRSSQQQRPSSVTSTGFALKRPHQHHSSSGFLPIKAFQEKQKQQQHQKPGAPVASATLSDILKRQGAASTSSGLKYHPTMLQKGTSQAQQQRSESASRSTKPAFPLGGTTWRLSERGLVQGAYFTVGDQQNLSPSNRLTSSSHNCNKDNTLRSSPSSTVHLAQDPDLPLDFSTKGKSDASKSVMKDWFGESNGR